jgi:hypothetical protein
MKKNTGSAYLNTVSASCGFLKRNMLDMAKINVNFLHEVVLPLKRCSLL